MQRALIFVRSGLIELGCPSALVHRGALVGFVDYNVVSDRLFPDEVDQLSFFDSGLFRDELETSHGDVDLAGTAKLRVYRARYGRYDIGFGRCTGDRSETQKNTHGDCCDDADT